MKNVKLKNEFGEKIKEIFDLKEEVYNIKYIIDGEVYNVKYTINKEIEKITNKEK